MYRHGWDPKLRELHISFGMKLSKRLETRLRLIGKETGQPQPDKTLLQASLLPGQPDGPFYCLCVAHVSSSGGARSVSTSRKRTDLVFVHLHFLMRPPGTPPKSVREAHKRGRTSEWLVEELGSCVQPKQPVSVETLLRFNVAPEQRTPSIVSVPLRHDGNTLSLVGAEYRSDAVRPGVTNFRWRARQDGGLDIWLDHVVLWENLLKDGETPWTTETERSGSLARELY
jgi:hypothetical protein